MINRCYLSLFSVLFLFWLMRLQLSWYCDLILVTGLWIFFWIVDTVCCVFSVCLSCFVFLLQMVVLWCMVVMYLILVLFLGCWNENEDNSYMILSDFYWWVFPCPVLLFLSLEEMINIVGEFGLRLIVIVVLEELCLC